MKATVCLLGMYMLVLAMVPCGDSGSGIVESVQHLLNIEHQEHQEHDQHDNSCTDDDCSPFCICSCCSSALDFPIDLPLQIKSKPPAVATVPSFIPHFTGIPFIASVWQPPKHC